MDSKDRKLLLRDLGGRLLSDVLVEVIEDGWDISTRLDIGTQPLTAYWLDRVCNKYYDIKPHLFTIKDALKSKAFVEEITAMFPDSDQTELESGTFDFGGYSWVSLEEMDILIDILNRHKVDWRGLIKKGLAIDAAVSHVYEFIEP
jgi:hypothetical protein